jgi:hypothetical protein
MMRNAAGAACLLQIFATAMLLQLRRVSGVTSAGVQGAPWIETIAWKPRAMVYHNFLSYEECDHVIAVAKPSMKRSTVIDRSAAARCAVLGVGEEGAYACMGFAVRGGSAGKSWPVHTPPLTCAHTSTPHCYSDSTTVLPIHCSSSPPLPFFSLLDASYSDGRVVADDPIRTSSGTFIGRSHDAVISAIQKRLETWTHIPHENYEDMQVSA